MNRELKLTFNDDIIFIDNNLIIKKKVYIDYIFPLKK